MEYKNNIAIIPARGGSKRIPKKNIIDFGGIPLILHSINYAKFNSNIIDEIYVSTDNADIKKIALENGVKVIDRPKEISGDYEPTITALQHILEELDHEVKNVILLQPTNPLRPKNLLKKAYQLFLENDSNSLFTVTQNDKKFGKVKNNTYIPFNYTVGQRSQDLEPLFYENGLMYIAKAEVIKNGYVISEDAYSLKVDHIFATVDIDTYQDLEYAEFILNKYKEF